MSKALTKSQRETHKRFTAAMLEKLRRNAHKGGWRQDAPEALLARVYEELRELESAIRNEGDEWEINEEAADVANMVMMVADVVVRSQRRTARGTT